MHQDELKAMVGRAALAHVPPGSIVGVGTGSTVNHFIQALAREPGRVRGAVSSSEASTQRLQAVGIAVLDANEVGELAVYIDGADEINAKGEMIKGGGGALTCEKIVAAQSRTFVCIADESKPVQTLGRFPLPVEVIPMAVRQLQRRFESLGGRCVLRQREGIALRTDNGQFILDVHGLAIEDAESLEREVNQWPGVVTVGLFALQKASLALIGTAQGVRELRFA